MSTWRDIWRFGVIANRFYAENKDWGESAFKELKRIPKKDDGMIHFIYAASLEQAGDTQTALSEYKKAKDLFPVEHWKKVADDACRRIETSKTLDEFFNKENFNDYLWYAFHKVYTLVHLNDFARYVCLSALARGSSEWPLSLVDFRTVLELEIKQNFSKELEYYFDEEKYSLKDAIDYLGKIKEIPEKIEAFHSIRIAGNIAAHKLFASEAYKYENLKSLIEILEFFDDYSQKNKRYSFVHEEYPLCQITIDEFKEKIEEKLKELKENPD